MTYVNAKAKNREVRGQSGRGKDIGRLLRGSNNPDAREFLSMLSMLSEKYPDYRSPFSCAEPHAFALLLASGCKLAEIEIVGLAVQPHLKKTIDECKNCSDWLHLGGYSEPYFPEELTNPTVQEAGRTADLSDHKQFVYHDDDFPKL